MEKYYVVTNFMSSSAEVISVEGLKVHLYHPNGNYSHTIDDFNESDLKNFFDDIIVLAEFDTFEEAKKFETEYDENN